MIRFSSTVAPLTPAAVERGASGVVMVGMGVLKGAGCNGNAGKVRRARWRVSWSAPDRLDQGTDVRGLSSTGYLHKIPITFCCSSDGFRSFLCKRKRTKPKHPSLPLVSPRVAGCARMDTSAEDRPEHLGVETHTTFTIFGRKAHTSTIVTNERSNPRTFLSAFCAVQA